jgi:integrase
MRPTPKFQNGRWFLDLRWAGGPRAIPLSALDEPVDAAEALHRAYARYQAMRDEQHAEQARQQSLDFEAPTIAEVIRAFKPTQERRRIPPGSRRYIAQNLNALDRELGGTRVAAFEKPHGDALWADYDNRLADDDDLDWKTRRNRHNMLKQLFTFAHGRGWMRSIPIKPKATAGDSGKKKLPRGGWYTEGAFRALRDGLYRNEGPRARLKHHIRDEAEREAFIARRRLYLSVAFYTGMHTHDLNELRGEHFSVGARRFLRINSKSARCVDPVWLPMPQPLFDDVVEEQRRLGRPWHPDEPVAGGLWNSNSAMREIRRTAARLKLPLPFDFRICRRSVAFHLALLGWTERDVSEYLGHVDQEMVREVYVAWPEYRSPSKLPWTHENMRAVRGEISAREHVIDFAAALKDKRHGPHRGEAPTAAPAKGRASGEGGGDAD